VDVFDAIRRRRSIKPDRMKPDPVEPALLERLFEAANWAPSHGLTEPWRFVVFRRGPARDALFDAVVSTMTAPDEPPIGPDDGRRTALAQKMLRPPVMIALVAAVSTNPKIDAQEELMSTAMAVENLHLAATALGLGVFWTSGKKATDPRMARFLGLEPPHRCLGFLYVGWPEDGAWPEGTRRPVAEKVTWKD
jgi:nitroreductase